MPGAMTQHYIDRIEHLRKAIDSVRADLSALRVELPERSEDIQDMIDEIEQAKKDLKTGNYREDGHDE